MPINMSKSSFFSCLIQPDQHVKQIVGLPIEIAHLQDTEVVVRCRAQEEHLIGFFRPQGQAATAQDISVGFVQRILAPIQKLITRYHTLLLFS